MGEHALGLEIGEEAKRLTFEDLEAGSAGATRTAGAGPSNGRAPRGIACAITSAAGRRVRSTANALESYASEREGGCACDGAVRAAVLRQSDVAGGEEGSARTRPPSPHIGVDNARTGFFTHEEMEKIASRIGPQLENLVRVAFWTGWRQGELLNLKWARLIGWRVCCGSDRPRLSPARREDERRSCLPFPATGDRSTRRSAPSGPIRTTSLPHWHDPSARLSSRGESNPGV